MATIRTEALLQQRLADVRALLDKHRILDTLTQRQQGPRHDLVESLQHRQNLAELYRRLRALHVADAAYVLEALPLDDRRTVWEQIDPDRAGLVFVEVSDAVRESLVDFTAREDLVKLLTTLDPEDLLYVSDSLADDVLNEVARALDSGNQSVFQEAILYPHDEVGHHMTRDWVAVPETYAVEEVVADLRARGSLPPQTDRVFVVDARLLLRGAVPLQALLLNDPLAPVTSAIADDTVILRPRDTAANAVNAFERYNLVSAPVVDDRGKLVGRLTVETVIDVLRDEANSQALKTAGLSGDEDVFAMPWDSARNRWPWLAVNLVTAFIASRVIGRFEGAIAQLAALATLMPIVASVGGNTGNQTMALVVRSLALGRIQSQNALRLLRKELLVGLLNGAVWGVVLGVMATGLYANAPLGLVMASAVVLNLLVAAAAGVAIPIWLHAVGRDPALGSSVLLTFVTDAMGFFWVLWLASVFIL